MSRQFYKNGDEVKTEEKECDGCSPSIEFIANGKKIIHDPGCPDAWRDNTNKREEGN